MDRFLSITEMARRRNITTETLRHYDRIGLLKPDYLDQNRVRYYSILKYEQLETIRELQQLGLDLKEIKDYLSNRCVDTSHALLLRQQSYCKERIQYYQVLEKKIEQKVSLLSELKTHEQPQMEPVLTRIAERFCLRSDIAVEDEISLGYACMDLENQVKRYDPLAPVYGSDCYAGQFDLHSETLSRTQLLFILRANNSPNISASAILPAGDYLCLCSSGSFWD